MSHELEFNRDGTAKMFFVGDERPWHGLGTHLSDPPSIEEGIKCAGLDWNVSREKLTMEDGRTVPAFGVVRDTDKAILGVVGPKWRPVQNLTAFNWFQPWLDSKQVTLETAGCLKGGSHVWVLARIQKDPAEVVPGDALIRYILLSNSHDGSRMVRAGFTATRVVCWNTVNAALTSKQSKMMRVRHTENAEEALKDIQSTMELADQRFAATLDQMRAMARKGVTKESLRDYVTRVFKPQPVTTDENEAMTEEQEEKCERLVDRIIPLFESGRGNDLKGVKGTVWGAYNAVTEYLTWERGRTADNRLTSLWLGDGQAVAQRAFDLAVKIAA